MKKESNSRLQLMDAVVRNDVNSVKNLVMKGAYLDSKDSDGVTPLYEAVQSSYQEIALVLIKSGSDVNARDRRGTSVLMEAIKRKQFNVIQELFSKNINIHHRSRAGANALITAAIFGDSDLIKDLVMLGAKIEENNFESLTQSVSFGNIQTTQKILQLGANPNSFLNSNGDTLLMTSIKQGCLEIFKILIKYGANTEVINKNGESILEIARKMKMQDIINILEN
jgi:ankyrin repeat protein